MVIDLIKRHKNDQILLDKIKDQNKTASHPIFKVGDVISFYGGYNNDIKYISKITGFDEDGDIYLLWDCFWFPIRNTDPNRKIKIINNYKAN